MGFTAFVRPEDHEGASASFKPLLPPKSSASINMSGKSGKSAAQEPTQSNQVRAQTRAQTQTQPQPQPQAPAASSPVSIYFQPPPSLTPTESFERTRYDNSSPPPFSSQPVWPSSSKHELHYVDDFSFPQGNVMNALGGQLSSDVDLPSVLPQADEDHIGSYTGSYWFVHLLSFHLVISCE